MTLNPEFQRNLWLQLSPQRLIAAPAILGLGVLAVELADGDRAGLGFMARITFFVLVAVWGTRRAADSVADEVVGGTWDSQRMSAIGAWPMSWGKLLGSTIYVWYCAALCLAIYVYALLPGMALDRFLVDVAILVGVGLLGQAVAMADCLLFLGRGPAIRRIQVMASQVIGLVVVLGLPIGLSMNPAAVAQDVTFDWYGIAADAAVFTMVSVWAFAGWALLAVYRLMRQELQYRNYPFIWLAFVVFLVVYAEGCLYRDLMEAGISVGAWLVAPAAITAVLTYVMLFLQPKDVVRYRWFGSALFHGNVRVALRLTPLWLPTFLLTVGLTAGFVLLDLSEPAAFPPELRYVPALPEVVSGAWASALAILLFMARDIALVLVLSFASRFRRASLAAVLYLLVLYLLLPAIVGLLGGGALLPLLLPVPGASPALTVLAPLVEAAAMAAFLVWRMVEVRPMPLAARPA
jgi:hypothetical protein